MKKIKIGLIAEEKSAKLHFLAHKENKLSEVIGIYSNTRELLDLFNCKKYESYQSLIQDKEIEVVEIVSKSSSGYKYAMDSLNIGKSISIDFSSIESIGQLNELVKTAKSKRQKIYFYLPSLFYEPYCEAKKLLDEGKIGEIQAIKIKSIFGKESIENSTREEIIFKSVCEKLALSYFFLGDIEKIFSYGMQSQNNFAPAIVMWKYKKPCRYGICEVIIAPDMLISSKYSENYEDIEITGTSGYIWLTNQKGNIQNIPALSIYRKDKLYIYENLKDDYFDAFKSCTKYFVEYLMSKKKAHPSVDEVKKILNFVISARKSSSEGKEILV